MEPVIETWPVVTGCYRISKGCYSCPSYWEYLQEGKDYTPVIHPDKLVVPWQTREDTIFQVAFGSDLFDKKVPDKFIKEVFKVMNSSTHTFEIVTKRIDRASHMYITGKLSFTPNINLGVAVENVEYVWRIEALKLIPAAIRYVSMVPILGPMGDLDLEGIDHVTAVKETWGYKRPAKQEWIDSVEKQCKEQGVGFSKNHIVYKNEELIWQEQPQQQ